MPPSLDERCMLVFQIRDTSQVFIFFAFTGIKLKKHAFFTYLREIE